MMKPCKLNAEEKMEIKGKVAVITGGASGIGLAMSRLFARKGAKVILSDVNAEGIERAVAEINADHGSAFGIISDVRKEPDAEKLMTTAVDKFGGLDIAILNAGILRDGLLLRVDRETREIKGKMSLKEWQDIIDVNLTGVFLTGREAALQMVKLGRGGVIIPISSISRTGNFGQTNYSAAKAGVASMTCVWSKELARYGIRVAGIAPGFVETPMICRDMKPEALEKWKAAIPVGRLGAPEEIAHTALYICECDFVTGTVIEVTGGVRI
jgi:3-oxoacyl-[acyl-carrier protein] reductase